LAAAYIRQGREGEAHAEAKIIMKANPIFSIRQLKARIPLKDELALDNFVEALRKAGLPE